MRWKCICAYDGTDFGGWQRQPHGDAVQNYIEASLCNIFASTVQIHGSGRTDAGVHANGQCFHFDADWKHPPEKLIRALHAQLPTTIQIKSLQPVSDEFHARFSVIGKRYTFRYYLGRAEPRDDRYVWSCRDIPLDLKAMNAAAQRLIGEHDFTAYSASHSKNNDPNPVKTVSRLDITQHGQQLTLTAEGSGFLYKMVRSFAGAFYAVGRGRLSPEDISEILASRQRTHRIVTAPGTGLSLDHVFYK